MQQIHLEPVLGNHSVANAVTGGLFGSVLSLPTVGQPRSAGTTLGQVVTWGLSFQPAVDSLVLPEDGQQTLQATAPQQQQQQTLQQQSQWDVDSEGRWVWQVEDREHWYQVQPDGSLRCLNTEPDVPQGTVFAPGCVVFAPLGGPRGQPKQQQQSLRGSSGNIVRYTTWWGGGPTFRLTPVCGALGRTWGCCSIQSGKPHAGWLNSSAGHSRDGLRTLGCAHGCGATATAT